MAQSQAADGRPDCRHIRREVVSSDERNRSLTFGLRKNTVLSTCLDQGPEKTDFKDCVTVLARKEVVE